LLFLLQRSKISLDPSKRPVGAKKKAAVPAKVESHSETTKTVQVQVGDRVIYSSGLEFYRGNCRRGMGVREGKN
jgi:hypothetical protein